MVVPSLKTVNLSTGPTSSQMTYNLDQTSYRDPVSSLAALNSWARQLRNTMASWVLGNSSGLHFWSAIPQSLLL